ncbi:hypothetical protein [Massilia sp. IC2-476]|uniref:hypothetical protein n=1 Tax=Massilia sp. IC2-476 TaxID=2887199 RepID=UPI001D12DA9F|nr:hypothetical protein [Massilia sp. IC2-476]MCC2971109.1 hypothetical protein [Massilia sp. IC2-476]
MHEQLADLPAHTPGFKDTLKAAVQKRNGQLAEYFDHWSAAGAAANAIRQLTGTSETGIGPALATLAGIEACLDRVHGCYTELGWIPRHNGDFDGDSFLRMVLERNIANSKIRALGELPEEFHDEFRHLFDGGSPALRNSDSIREELDALRADLDALLGRTDDFSLFMDTPPQEASPRLQALRADLDMLWEGFRAAAGAAARQF